MQGSKRIRVKLNDKFNVFCRSDHLMELPRKLVHGFSIILKIFKVLLGLFDAV